MTNPIDRIITEGVGEIIDSGYRDIDAGTVVISRWKPIAIVLASAVALAGCSSTPSTAPSQIATDANLIATGLSAAVAQIALVPGVNQTTLATIQADVTLVQKDAASIASATSAPSASTVAEIVQTVQAVAPVALALVPGGSALVPVIDAAVSLAPALIADIEAVKTASAEAPGGTVAPYSAGEARLILKGATVASK
jgi:hypothetical protein